MAIKLTKRVVDTLEAPDPDEPRRYVFDSEVPGFGVIVQPSGVRTFFVQYRVGGGRRASKRRLAIGRYGTLTVDQARTRAKELLADVTKGADPAEQRDEHRRSPTVRELGADYLADVDARRKARTAAGYKWLWDAHVLPALGARKVQHVTGREVRALHRKLRETPYGANRVLALVSSFFTYAERQGVRPQHTNPARGIERYPERARERFLTPDEVTRLGAALTRAATIGLPPAPIHRPKRKTGPTAKHRPKSADTPRPANLFAVAAVRFLLLSGWREREALTLQWAEVDLERRIATLGDTKTGKSVRHLGAPAIALLDELPRVEGCPYVFPGRLQKGKPPAPLVEINRLWYAVRHAANLGDVRLHDLRHSFASTIASAGGSLLIIRNLLGHKDAKTTQRYAHLFEDPIRRVADETASTLVGWLEAPAPGVAANR